MEQFYNYRKKTAPFTTVNAVQWSKDGDYPGVTAFTKDIMTRCPRCGSVGEGHAGLTNMSFEVPAHIPICPGDWLLKEEANEVYPSIMSDVGFRNVYEPIY